MQDRTYKFDELAANLIAARRVCPFLPECEFIQSRNQSDHGAIKFAIRYCGDTYDRCPLYRRRMSKPEEFATTPDSPASRDGPTE